MSHDEKANLFAVYLKQDDPKKNTVVQLAKFNLIKLKSKIQHCPRRAIVLDPFAKIQIKKSDRDLLINHGLVVIDCSWKNTESIFKKPYKLGRNLPHLLAVNPINYGKWDRLSSVEALAAALYITGFQSQAQELLTKFHWGHNFWKLNDFSTIN